MAKQMLINTVADQECRIAIVDDGGQLEELYIERTSSASHVGNVYKGRITNVEPSIQAAFVDCGLGKNGFLHISDVHPQHFPGSDGEPEAVGRKRSHKDRPPIQKCLKRGQEVIVQMTKEGIGTKGPTMTTYLSIPGRLLVMMPGMSKLGVSRKIEDDAVRDRARNILKELNTPDDMGFIVRTAGADRSKRDLQRDLNYLLRLWKQVKQTVKRSKAPMEIYRESDLVIRTLRDIYNSDIKRIVCDSKEVAKRVRDFLRVAVPRGKRKIELYRGKEGLFHEFDLEEEIERIYSRRVELKSGGSLVIDQTEALVAIDVNSGRFRKHSDAETNALNMNLEAAKAVGRQLRLRDLGGVIVIDFIDMRDEKHRRAVHKAMRDAIKNDRAKTKLLRISALGLLEMTRQRIGPSLKSSIYRTCDSCEGLGVIKSEESQALKAMRMLQRICASDQIARIDVAVRPEVAEYLANYQRKRLAELEQQNDKRIFIKSDGNLVGEDMKISCTNSRGSSVSWPDQDSKKKKPSDIETENIDRIIKQEKENAEQEPKKDSEKKDEKQSDQQDQKKKKSRRRGRRGGRRRKKSDKSDQQSQDNKQPASQKDQKSDSGKSEKEDDRKKTQDSKDSGEDKSQKSDHASKDQKNKDRNTDKSDDFRKTDQKPDDRKEDNQNSSDEKSQDQKSKTQNKSRRRGRRGGRKHKKSSENVAENQNQQTKNDQQSGKEESRSQNQSKQNDSTSKPDSEKSQPSQESDKKQATEETGNSTQENSPKPKRKRRPRRRPKNDDAKEQTSDNDKNDNAKTQTDESTRDVQ